MIKRSSRVLATAALAAVLAGPACRQGVDGKGRGDMPQRDIQTVQEANIPSLMALPGVTGVAIGALDAGTPCIVIYVRELTDALRASLPTSLEGHPVQVEVSGEIRPLGR